MNAENPTTILVARSTPGAEIAARLALRPERPLAIVMGGAAKLSPEDYNRLERCIHEGLAPALAQAGAAVLDGGTDSGIMGLLNAALGALGYTGPYIGVAPRGRILQAGEDPEGRYPLGAVHTHVVQVEGDEFGDERGPLFGLAAHLSAGQHSLAVLGNGGSGSEKEILENVRQQREILLLRGSGRLADELVAALEAPQWARLELQQLVTLGQFSIFDIRNPPNFLEQVVEHKLGTG